MAIPTGVGDRNHQSFVESGTGITARRVHVTGGTLASVTGVVGTVNVIAILGTLTSVQTLGTVQAATVDMMKAGTLDMVKAGTVSMLVAGTVDTNKMLQAGTLDMLKAGTISKLTSGTVDTVSMLSAGTVTTVGALQAGTVDMLKAGTIDMLKAGTISSVGGTVNVNLSTLISGEDQANDQMKVMMQGGTLEAGSVDILKAGTLDMVKAGTVDMLKAGTVSMLSAGTVTTVGMLQAGTLSTVTGTVSVEQGFSGTHISTVGTTNILTAAGHLHLITFNTATAGTTTLVDGTVGDAASATVAIIANTGTLPFTLGYNRKMSLGLGVINGGTADLTVVYR